MRTVKISDAALAVLSSCTIYVILDGSRNSLVKIKSGQLDRKLYTEVNKVLVEIGGRWNRASQGHAFPTPVAETEERLEGVILTGEITPRGKNGFFPTPPELADRVAEAARLCSGQRILEPSAGSGSLIDAIIRKVGDASGHVSIATTIRAIEVMEDLARGLGVKYALQPTVLVALQDFLLWEIEGSVERYGYDRIVMNPPFEKRADAKHVLHAYNLLRPGGRLVAIMSAGVTFRTEEDYAKVRTLIADYGKLEHLPEGSFKSAGTQVSTVLVVINKPARA